MKLMNHKEAISGVSRRAASLSFFRGATRIDAFSSSGIHDVKLWGWNPLWQQVKSWPGSCAYAECAQPEKCRETKAKSGQTPWIFTSNCASSQSNFLCCRHIVKLVLFPFKPIWVRFSTICHWKIPNSRANKGKKQIEKETKAHRYGQ